MALPRCHDDDDVDYDDKYDDDDDSKNVDTDDDHDSDLGEDIIVTGPNTKLVTLASTKLTMMMTMKKMTMIKDDEDWNMGRGTYIKFGLPLQCCCVKTCTNK